MKTGAIFCCLLAGIVLCIGTASGKIITLSDDDKESILNAHNNYRSWVRPTAANMVELEWSDLLANIAQKYLENCKYYHSNKAERDKAAAPYFSSVGENILAYTGRKMYIWYLIEIMAEEGEYYNYPFCQSGRNCRRYTQIIWATTTHVGCALAHCPAGRGKTREILVCNYGPAGNTPGVNPYIKGSTCSQCPVSHDACYWDLCLPADTLLNRFPF
ncbi:peptidase inhibitor 16-like isoform X2 [Halichondria panicea]|uniref:peptidase inhibitor 16-like isoform X2 n=1 Tax=Halichondria panicea TaxID=6063 RepID=UPI00312B6BAF